MTVGKTIKPRVVVRAIRWKQHCWSSESLESQMAGVSDKNGQPKNGKYDL